MLRLSVATICVAVLLGEPLAAGAQTPAPAKAKATGSAVRSSHGRALGHVGLHGSPINRPVSAAACHGRAMTLPTLSETMGPNGASQSRTVVSVPIGGSESTASATKRQQLAEACAHVRR